MITLLLIVLCLVSLSVGTARQLELSETGWTCSTAATSLSVGILLQGLVSLALTSAGLGGFPITLIIGFSSITFFSIDRNRSQLIYFVNSVAGRIGNIGVDRERKISMLIVLLGAIALLISVGPVNHPDAADYHAGYPYLYWQTGKLAVDGGLHQGLLGLGDFAYIPIFQEGSTWMIRSVQGLCIPIVVATLLLRDTSKWIIVAFLSSPVLLQWLTTAKPLFLGEACLAISYLYWKDKQSPTSAAMCVACILSAVSFKISALIIAIPIVYDLVTSWIRKRSVELQLTFPHLIISAGGLAAIILHRFLITGNPLYPLLARVFSADNAQRIAFESMLRSYGRDAFFPFSLIVPKSLGEVGMTFGPALGLLLILFIFQQLWIRRFQSPQWTALLQIGLLLLLGQGRPDYYACPVLLLLSGQQLRFDSLLNPVEPIGNIRASTTRKFLTLTFALMLAGQLMGFVLLSGASLYQSIASWHNYESLMKQYAYGYHVSEIINKQAIPPIADLVHRNTRLYYKKPYIDSDRFNKCLGDEGLATGDTKIVTCMNILNVNTLVIEKGILDQNKQFACKREKAMSGSRNPFNRSQEEFDLCTHQPPGAARSISQQ